MFIQGLNTMEITKEIKKLGNSAYILLPKKYIGQQASIIIIEGENHENNNSSPAGQEDNSNSSQPTRTN